MTAIKRIDVFEDLYEKDSTDIGVANLASLLSVQQKDLAKAFEVSPSAASRNGISANNAVMKQWMRIFNLVIDMIEASGPAMDKGVVQLKMSRYLKLPNSHFGGQTLLDVMMKGQSRKVIRFLEQLTS